MGSVVVELCWRVSFSLIRRKKEKTEGKKKKKKKKGSRDSEGFLKDGRTSGRKVDGSSNGIKLEIAG